MQSLLLNSEVLLWSLFNIALLSFLLHSPSTTYFFTNVTVFDGITHSSVVFMQPLGLMQYLKSSEKVPEEADRMHVRDNLKAVQVTFLSLSPHSHSFIHTFTIFHFSFLLSMVVILYLCEYIWLSSSPKPLVWFCNKECVFPGSSVGRALA